MKNIYIALLATSVLCTSLYGEYQYNAVNSSNGTTKQQKRNNTGSQVIGRDISEKTPRDKYPNRQRDREEMKTAERSAQYKDTQILDTQRQRVLGGIYDIELSMTPEYRVLRGLDNLYVSPVFVTTISLPKDMVITDSVASFPTTRFEYNQNILRFQPKADKFFSGNIPITMTDGKKNYFMSIYVEKFYQPSKDSVNAKIKKSPSAVAKDIVSPPQDEEIYFRLKNGEDERYRSANNKVSLVYNYVLPSLISDEDAIILYERMTGKKGIDIENGDYVSFLYDGIKYKIIRDDKQGILIYGNKAYRVENSTQRGVDW